MTMMMLMLMMMMAIMIMLNILMTMLMIWMFRWERRRRLGGNTKMPWRMERPQVAIFIVIMMMTTVQELNMRTIFQKISSNVRVSWSTEGHVGVTARHSNRFRVSVNTSPHRLRDEGDWNYADNDGGWPKAISPMKCLFSIVTFYLLYEELLGRRGGNYFVSYYFLSLTKSSVTSCSLRIIIIIMIMRCVRVHSEHLAAPETCKLQPWGRHHWAEELHQARGAWGGWWLF